MARRALFICSGMLPAWAARLILPVPHQHSASLTPFAYLVSAFRRTANGACKISSTYGAGALLG